MKQLVVNGERVSPASIDQERQQLMRELKLSGQSIPNDRIRLIIDDRARQNVIDHYLFKQEAVKRGFKSDKVDIENQVQQLVERNGGLESVSKYLAEINETIDDLRTHIADRLLVDQLVNSVQEKISLPKERHAKKHYKENQSDYLTETSVEVRWFVKNFDSFLEKRKAREEVEKVVKSVRAGKAFSTLIKQRSDQPENDGLVGVVKKGELDTAFDEFIFSNETGAISDPIERNGTWYALLVGQIFEGKQLEFDEVKDEIIRKLFEEEKREALKKVLDKLRNKAKVEDL